MPVNIPDKLPAADILKKEHIFVMTHSRANTQDIRPIHIGILNLMPIKETTETQLIRMLANTQLQIIIDLIFTQTHTSKNTSATHLKSFYTSFKNIKKLDGLIITGAPIEHLQFEDVEYWSELTEIYEWSKENVTSTFHICWGAQAALYYYFNIPKYEYNSKLFGIFKHKILDKNAFLTQGMDDEFWAPHSRNTYTRKEDVIANPNLEILCESEEAGIYLMATKDKKNVFVTGHSEYDATTLQDEYLRDKNKGLDIALPKNYFPNNNPDLKPVNIWKSNGNALFHNWLNYYVYQETPYDLL